MLARRALRPAVGNSTRPATTALKTCRTSKNHHRPASHISVTRTIRPNGRQSLHKDQFRSFSLGSIPSILVPPVVFTGLLSGLWTYKCLMTVLFQDKIIYMPYMPPFARSEKIEDYSAGCKPVHWIKKDIKSLDGTKIALAIGEIPPESRPNNPEQHILICYFHGNGGSVPPRLPLLSNTLKLTHARSATTTHTTLIALSYRGYWTSSGRASERGIKLDAQATLNWISSTYPHAKIILWGQSIGAGVACSAAATLNAPRIAGLILETPFTSVKSMLLALYPQKWLPYRYLYPFLWNHWDSEAALRRIASGAGQKPKVLLLPATRDEVVPPVEIEKLARVCGEVGLETRRVNVIGALHTEATTRREGQEAVARFAVGVAGR